MERDIILRWYLWGSPPCVGAVVVPPCPQHTAVLRSLIAYSVDDRVGCGGDVSGGVTVRGQKLRLQIVLIFSR